MSDELEEVTIRVPPRLLDEAFNFMVLEQITGNLLPQDNASQRLVLLVLRAAGRIKK